MSYGLTGLAPVADCPDAMATSTIVEQLVHLRIIFELKADGHRLRSRKWAVTIANDIGLFTEGKTQISENGSLLSERFQLASAALCIKGPESKKNGFGLSCR